MTIFQAVKDMTQEAKKLTNMGNFQAVVYDKCDDIIVEVFADALGCEFHAKAGREVFITDSIFEFVNALEHAVKF
jgi:hypothetical protein